MRSVTILILGMALAGCGGGAADGPKESEDERLLVATGLEGLDGTIILNSQTGSCEIDAVASGAVAGESEGSDKFITHWGFVTFDISQLPAGAEVRSATANLFMLESDGDNIFGSGLFGNVVMEHIDLGATLDEPDMLAPPLGGELVGGDASPTFLAATPALGYRAVDVTTEVLRDVDDGRSRTTLRLRCQVVRATDADLLDDQAVFAIFDPDDPDDPPAIPNREVRPFLEIRYVESEVR